MNVRVSREHFAKTKLQILEAAATLFETNGFDGVTVVDVMKTAGLTHGGFYRYFPSKHDLKSQACCLMVKRTAEGWNPLSSGDSATAAAQDEEAQKFVALACDSARESPRLQATFADGLEALIGKLCRDELKANTLLPREETLSAIVSLVGATVLARAVGRNKIGDEIRAVADETVRLSGMQRLNPNKPTKAAPTESAARSRP